MIVALDLTVEYGVACYVTAKKMRPPVKMETAAFLFDHCASETAMPYWWSVGPIFPCENKNKRKRAHVDIVKNEIVSQSISLSLPIAVPQWVFAVGSAS